MDNDLREKIAVNFLGKLTEWFASDNKRIDAEKVINANDYYDANMAMDYAFKACGVNPLDGDDEQVMSEQNINLWNSAWERAVELQSSNEATGAHQDAKKEPPEDGSIATRNGG